MKILTLQDALEYQIDLIAKFKRSGKATERDIEMTTYIREILEDRIAAKEGK